MQPTVLFTVCCLNKLTLTGAKSVRNQLEKLNDLIPKESVKATTLTSIQEMIQMALKDDKHKEKIVKSDLENKIKVTLRRIDDCERLLGIMKHEVTIQDSPIHSIINKKQVEAYLSNVSEENTKLRQIEVVHSNLQKSLCETLT